jgi:hypothetical protein
MVDGLHPTPKQQGAWDPVQEDTLASGRRFLTANLKDDLTRECTAILVDFSPRGQRVAMNLDDVVREPGCPDTHVVDNRPSAVGRSDLRSGGGQDAAKGPGVHRPRR